MLFPLIWEWRTVARNRVTENLNCFWLWSYKNTSEPSLWNSWFLVHKSDLVSLFCLYALMRLAEPPHVFCVFPWKTSWEEDSSQGRDSQFLSPLARCLLHKLNLQSVYRNQEQKVVAVIAGIRHCTQRGSFRQLIISKTLKLSVCVCLAVHLAIHLSMALCWEKNKVNKQS